MDLFQIEVPEPFSITIDKQPDLKIPIDMWPEEISESESEDNDDEVNESIKSMITEIRSIAKSIYI